MGKKHRSKEDQEEEENKPVPSKISDRKVLNNIRIYKRDEPIVETQETVSPVTRYLPQFLANFAINFLMADMGLALSYPTVVIAALYTHNRSISRRVNTDDEFGHLSIFENFSFNSIESSVYSSLPYLFVPVGSILGGFIVDIIGRKKIMFLANLPMILGWLLHFFSRDIVFLMFASIFFGLGIGLTQSAAATYQGEVSEPRVRGTIVNLSGAMLSISSALPFLLHLLLPSWRWIALICVIVPVAGCVAALIVPESPSWLLSKGQITLAEKSLSRLRGGATKSEIQEEMSQLSNYHNMSNRRHPAGQQHFSPTDGLLTKGESLKQTLKFLKSPEMWRPLILSIVMFVIMYTTGISTMRPFFKPVLDSLHFEPKQWNLYSLTLSLVGVLGTMIAVFIIGFTGKRALILSALLLNVVGSVLLAVSIIKNLSIGVKAFAFHLMSFVAGYGIIPIPWILQSELYPFRGRGLAVGLSSGFSSIFGCICILIFLPLMHAITLQAMLFIFSVFSLAGCIFLYLKLPETEGRSLEQIESFFLSDKPMSN